MGINRQAIAFCCLGLFWIGVPPRAMDQAAHPPAEQVENPAGRAVAGDWILSLQRQDRDSTAGETVYVLSLEGTATVIPANVQPTVWWITPGERRASLPLRPVDERHWASLVTPRNEPGRHRLVLLLLEPSGTDRLDRVVEQSFDLELPQGLLQPRQQRVLENIALNAPVPIDLLDHPVEPMSMPSLQSAAAKPLTLVSVLMPWTLLNLLFALLVLGPAMLFHRLPRSLRRWLGRPLESLPGVKLERRLVHSILYRTGMITDLDEELVTASSPAASEESGKASILSGELPEPVGTDVLLAQKEENPEGDAEREIKLDLSDLSF